MQDLRDRVAWTGFFSVQGEQGLKRSYLSAGPEEGAQAKMKIVLEEMVIVKWEAVVNSSAVVVVVTLVVGAGVALTEFWAAAFVHAPLAFYNDGGGCVRVSQMSRVREVCVEFLNRVSEAS